MGSKKPSKQRKLLYQAPWHRRRQMLSAHLSPELREKYGLRSFPVRAGDVVRIMRGDFAGEEGKVLKVDYKRYRIYIDKITREKVDGSTVPVPIHPSKVMIKKLDLSDRIRRGKLEFIARSKS